MWINLYDNYVWKRFIIYAFNISDSFSLTNYCWSDDKKLNYEYYCLNEQLENDMINNCCLPHGIWGEFTVTYYKCNYHAMSIIQTIPNISEMIFPKFPEDISFYINEKMWFKSVTHDEYWEVIDLNIQDELRNGLF